MRLNVFTANSTENEVPLFADYMAKTCLILRLKKILLGINTVVIPVLSKLLILGGENIYLSKRVPSLIENSLKLCMLRDVSPLALVDSGAPGYVHMTRNKFSGNKSYITIIFNNWIYSCFLFDPVTLNLLSFLGSKVFMLRKSKTIFLLHYKHKIIGASYFAPSTCPRKKEHLALTTHMSAGKQMIG